MAQSASEPNPWYHEGLRFQCSGCGDCCTGAPGYVWVNKEEIAAMAQHVDLSVKAFERKYVRRIGIRKSLLEFKNGDCVFFDTASRNCRIYDFRPRQCRTWPFWDSNLRTPETWQATCEACPGCDKGKLHSIEGIEEARKTFHV